MRVVLWRQHRDNQNLNFWNQQSQQQIPGSWDSLAIQEDGSGAISALDGVGPGILL